MLRLFAALAMIAFLGACASRSTIPYDVSMNVTPVVSDGDGPQQYLLESSYVESSEQQTVRFPKLIALEGQEASVFVGSSSVAGDSGTECRMTVTRDEDQATVALCFRRLDEGRETRIVRQTITVPVNAPSAPPDSP